MLDGFLVSLPAAFKDTDIGAVHLLLSSRYFEIAILISVVGLEVTAQSYFAVILV